jgi:hypothetical protein
MRYLIDIIDTSNKPNIINQILNNQKTHNMKKYIVTFQVKGKAFNENNIDKMWFEGMTRKEIQARASVLARISNSKIVSIRLVK